MALDANDLQAIASLMEQKLDQKLDQKLEPIKTEILALNSTTNDLKESVSRIEERVNRIEKTLDEHYEAIIDNFASIKEAHTVIKIHDRMIIHKGDENERQ